MNYSNLVKLRIRRKPSIQTVLEKLDKASTELNSKIFDFSVEDVCNNSGFHATYSNPVNLIGHFG